MKNLYSLLNFLVFFTILSSSPSHSLTVGDLKELPRFEDYPAQQISKVNKKKAPPNSVNLSSHPEGKKYRTVLKEGAKKGSNFAQELMVITNGCGSSCQMVWIVHSKTGRIITCLYSQWGIDFRKDSALIVLNPITDDMIQDFEKEPEYTPALGLNVEYYTWDGKNLNLLKKLDGIKYIREKLKNSPVPEAKVIQ